jgi:hypothetical protein
MHGGRDRRSHDWLPLQAQCCRKPRGLSLCVWLAHLSVARSGARRSTPRRAAVPSCERRWVRASACVPPSPRARQSVQKTRLAAALSLIIAIRGLVAFIFRITVVIQSAVDSRRRPPRSGTIGGGETANRRPRCGAASLIGSPAREPCKPVPAPFCVPADLSDLGRCNHRKPLAPAHRAWVPRLVGQVPACAHELPDSRPTRPQRYHPRFPAARPAVTPRRPAAAAALTHA